jgi:aspartyl aminopeptidase
MMVSTLNICLGENEDEPVFIIPDLLPHLAHKEQYTKNLGDAIDASKMNLVFPECRNLIQMKKKQLKLMP